MSNVIRRKLKSFVIITTGGFAAFCGACYYTNEPKFYKSFIMPLVHQLDPEMTHKLAVGILKKQLITKPSYKDPPILRNTIWNLEFTNPIGLAAGFDKHGEAIKGLQKIGFGFVEIGSVTPKPQEGNPRPRLFRLLQDKAIINRYGFNSDGHDAVFNRLVALSIDEMSDRGIVGVNLGKNKDSTDAIDDYVKGVQKFAPVADYLVINISSPNTKDLRNLQQRKQLAIVLDKILEARDKIQMKHKTPILLKIASDLSQEGKEDVAAVLMRPGKSKIDGIIVSNSTVERPDTLQSPLKNEKGGLTGAPLKDLSTEAIKTMYSLTKGKICIIGVGGVSNGKDAYEKIRAGAALVQIYTSLVYEGFPVITTIKKELVECLRKDGFKSVKDAIGADVWKAEE